MNSDAVIEWRLKKVFTYFSCLHTCLAKETCLCHGTRKQFKQGSSERDHSDPRHTHHTGPISACKLATNSQWGPERVTAGRCDCYNWNTLSNKQRHLYRWQEDRHTCSQLLPQFGSGFGKGGGRF